MSVMTILMLSACLICLGAVWMTMRNLGRYRAVASVDAAAASAAADRDTSPVVTICIPARNEEKNITACVESLLAGQTRNIEVLAYNDHSTDGTAAVLKRLCEQDARVKAADVVDLPAGWNGKQFACDRMGRAASGRFLLFTDADVVFKPDAIGAALHAAGSSGADLVSTFPLQRTHTVGEALVVPMIHFLLLSYLPMGRMRSTNDPAASAGCGQFLFVRRESWERAGGHAAFKASMHDGIMLPRVMRSNGFKTDLFDGTGIASVRMYRGFEESWRGFAKNAYEGLGSVWLLLLLTVLHVLGHILPWAVMILAAFGVRFEPSAVGLAACAAALALTQRFIIALRMEQRFIGPALHPVGVAVMTAIQWWSFVLHLRGRREWKGRGGIIGAGA